VKKYLKGGTLGYDPNTQGEFGMIPVYEVKTGVAESERADSYRMVNIDTIIWVKANGEERKRVIEMIAGGLENESLDQEVGLSNEYNGNYH